MKCFYHNDSDGKCAAYWVHQAYPNAKPSDFIQMDYHKEFPFEVITDNEQVYIVDFSIPPEEMSILLKITPNVTWVDHHITAIEKYENFPEPIRGIRCNGIAACMLTYCYLNHMTDRGRGKEKPFDKKMTHKAPMFTTLIADWDVWKFDFGNDTRYFQMAFNSLDFTPGSKEWDYMTLYPDMQVKTLIENGKTIKQHRDEWAKSYCKARGFATTFEGHRCYAMNLGLCNSEYFDSQNHEDYDIYIPFSFDGRNWHYSLYSQKINVSEIAKKYGGGGHRGASGFTWDSLLLKKG